MCHDDSPNTCFHRFCIDQIAKFCDGSKVHLPGWYDIGHLEMHSLEWDIVEPIFPIIDIFVQRSSAANSVVQMKNLYICSNIE